MFFSNLSGKSPASWFHLEGSTRTPVLTLRHSNGQARWRAGDYLDLPFVSVVSEAHLAEIRVIDHVAGVVGPARGEAVSSC